VRLGLGLLTAPPPAVPALKEKRIHEIWALLAAPQIEVSRWRAAMVYRGRRCTSTPQRKPVH